MSGVSSSEDVIFMTKLELPISCGFTGKFFFLIIYFLKMLLDGRMAVVGELGEQDVDDALL